MRVGLVFGGRSVEHLVSIRSARTVKSALEQAGHTVVAIGVADTGAIVDPAVAVAALNRTDMSTPMQADAGEAHAVQRSYSKFAAVDVDVLFPILHGTYGEDGTFQGLAEMFDLPYVGCGVTASAVAMDKRMTKMLLERVGIPVVPYVAVERAQFILDPLGALEPCTALGDALFVKPNVGGSSVGCTLVGDVKNLRDAVAAAFVYADCVLVERAVKGREIEAAVIGSDPSAAGSAPFEAAATVGEIVPGAEFYDYADKYLNDTARLLAPAPLTDEILAQVRDYAARAMSAIGGAGLARVDFFLMGDTLYLNELNTLPGFTSASMYPRLFDLSGLSPAAVVDRLLQLAFARHQRAREIDAAQQAYVRGFK